MKNNKVDDSIVETDHEKTLADRELKKECFIFAREKFQGKKFRNIDIDRDILVSRDGLDKWYNSTKSREQSISIKKLDTILENSKQIDSMADRKNRHTVDGYTYFMIYLSTFFGLIFYVRHYAGGIGKEPGFRFLSQARTNSN